MTFDKPVLSKRARPKLLDGQALSIQALVRPLAIIVASGAEFGNESLSVVVLGLPRPLTAGAGKCVPMLLCKAPMLALAWLGRQSTRAIAALVFVGIALPAVDALLRP